MGGGLALRRVVSHAQHAYVRGNHGLTMGGELGVGARSGIVLNPLPVDQALAAASVVTVLPSISPIPPSLISPIPPSLPPLGGLVACDDCDGRLDDVIEDASEHVGTWLDSTRVLGAMSCDRRRWWLLQRSRMKPIRPDFRSLVLARFPSVVALPSLLRLLLRRLILGFLSSLIRRCRAGWWFGDGGRHGREEVEHEPRLEVDARDHPGARVQRALDDHARAEVDHDVDDEDAEHEVVEHRPALLVDTLVAPADPFVAEAKAQRKHEQQHHEK